MPDCRYPEDFPDSQVTKVPYTNTETKSAEEEKSHIPKKVGMALLSFLLLKSVKIFSSIVGRVKLCSNHSYLLLHLYKKIYILQNQLKF